MYTIFFVRSPIFLLLFEDKVSDNVLILEYWQEQEEYVISQVEIHAGFKLFEQIRISEEALKSPSNCLDLLAYNLIIAQEADPVTLFGSFVEQIQQMK